MHMLVVPILLFILIPDVHPSPAIDIVHSGDYNAESTSLEEVIDNRVENMCRRHPKICYDEEKSTLKLQFLQLLNATTSDLYDVIAGRFSFDFRVLIHYLEQLRQIIKLKLSKEEREMIRGMENYLVLYLYFKPIYDLIERKIENHEHRGMTTKQIREALERIAGKLENRERGNGTWESESEERRIPLFDLVNQTMEQKEEWGISSVLAYFNAFVHWGSGLVFGTILAIVIFIIIAITCYRKRDRKTMMRDRRLPTDREHTNSIPLLTTQSVHDEPRVPLTAVTAV